MLEINFMESTVNQLKTFSKRLYFTAKKYFKRIKEQSAILIRAHFIWAVA